MSFEKKYVSSHEKAEVILKALCHKSPQTVAELTKILMEEFGMKFTSARSSATDIVLRLINYDILEEVGSGEKGARLLEISPFGAYILIGYRPTIEATKLDIIDDITVYLNRKKRSEIVDLLKVYLHLKKQKHEEIEEEEKAKILDVLDVAVDFEDEITSWEELEEKILELCLDELEEYIDKKGGTLYLEELRKQLPKELKRTYKRILYAYKDKVNEEIQKYQLRKSKIQELIANFDQTNNE